MCINLLFVCKYIPRVGFSPVLFAFLYCVCVISCVVLYKCTIAKRINERIARNLVVALVITILSVITMSIIMIDPLSIRVDRWSATSYFLDALFNGVYPYSVHTHVCETNFPSPFPLWHYFHIPFWLLGDVGWQLVFFLLLFLFALYYYFQSWLPVLSYILLLCISPAYWWEVLTRSDGLSNALLAASCILYIERKHLSMQDDWWRLALISGCVASTRLSAVIPLALYLFKPWLDTKWKEKLGFLSVTIGIVVLFFIPYIFWDVNNWIFFTRNPFITQALLGDKWLLLVMVGIAIYIAYKKQTFYYFISTTSAFMFAFMLISQLGALFFSSAAPISFSDLYFDVSYLTLALPYTILVIIIKKNDSLKCKPSTP